MGRIVVKKSNERKPGNELKFDCVYCTKYGFKQMGQYQLATLSDLKEKDRDPEHLRSCLNPECIYNAYYCFFGYDRRKE